MDHTKDNATVERSIVDRMLWSGERNITRLIVVLVLALVLLAGWAVTETVLRHVEHRQWLDFMSGYDFETYDYSQDGDRGGYGMRYPGGYYPGSMYPVGGYRDGYADGGMRDGYGMRGGYRDGYGRNQDRDAAGRYADDMGMRDKLRTMMANTRDENTRQEIQRMMDTMA